MGKSEAVNEVEVRMSSGGPEGSPNLAGEWLPHQVMAQGGVLRDFGGGSHEEEGVVEEPKKGRKRGPKVVVMKGKDARKGIEALMKRYGVK